MSFQSTVFLQQGFGVVGELFTDAPKRAESFILNSADAAYNVFGRCFTVSAEGVARAGSGGAFGFAGFLVNPKGSALQGTLSGTLSPSLTLPNNAQGELLTMGSIIVSLPAAASIGDKVVFDNTTGELSTISTATFVLSGGTTSTDATVTMASTAGVLPGMGVSGAGVPVGATVVSVITNTSIELSAVATATATVPLTFTPTGNELPPGKTFANAVVDYFTVAGAGLAVITVSPSLVRPAPAV